MHDAERQDDDLTPAERELAEALGRLRPTAPLGINRDRLLFEAGAAAARRSVVRWRAAAAGLVIGNAVLLTAALQPSPARGPGGTSVAETPPAPPIPRAGRDDRPTSTSPAGAET